MLKPAAARVFVAALATLAVPVSMSATKFPMTPIMDPTVSTRNRTHRAQKLTYKFHRGTNGRAKSKQKFHAAANTLYTTRTMSTTKSSTATMVSGDRSKTKVGYMANPKAIQSTMLKYKVAHKNTNARKKWTIHVHSRPTMRRGTVNHGWNPSTTSKDVRTAPRRRSIPSEAPSVAARPTLAAPWAPAKTVSHVQVRALYGTEHSKVAIWVWRRRLVGGGTRRVHL